MLASFTDKDKKVANKIVVCKKPFYDKRFDETYIAGCKYKYIDMLYAISGIYDIFNIDKLGNPRGKNTLDSEWNSINYEDYFEFLAELREKKINEIFED